MNCCQLSSNVITFTVPAGGHAYVIVKFTGSRQKKVDVQAPTATPSSYTFDYCSNCHSTSQDFVQLFKNTTSNDISATASAFCSSQECGTQPTFTAATNGRQIFQACNPNGQNSVVIGAWEFDCGGGDKIQITIASEDEVTGGT